MASIPQRHTYYGGETSVYTQSETTTRIRRKHVTFGPYILGSTLGEGEFGKVKLGWSKAASAPLEVPKQVAIKLIRRDSIPKNSEKEIKIYREINALKHLSHPNIVRLEEVLQNSKYIGIVLEYASGGEFYKYIQRKRRLKEAVACRLFAQLISGVNYMHSKGLVHRDLKLENLLLDKHENLVITDFGFVNEFVTHNELMKTSCGSPCYAAPELVVSTKPYEARKSDVWSCGVILYAMSAGYLPWDDDPRNPDGNDIVRLYQYITRTPLKFPEYITPLSRDLLRRILVSDPRRRITLKNIQRHEWLKPHSQFLSITPEEWDKAMLAKGVFRPPRPVHTSKRPQSSCSTSSTGSKGEKRDSLVMDYTLVPLPAPPHQSQSHVITKPSPPSPEMRVSPVRHNMNRHSRSDSAASIALQAVVNAEREGINTIGSGGGNAHNSSVGTRANASGDHMSANINVSGTGTSTNRNVAKFVIQRSNSVTGSVSPLINHDSAIMEKGLLAGKSLEAPQPNRNITPLLNDGLIHSNKVTHRKPRPTSYHPGSMAANRSASPGTMDTLTGVANMAASRAMSTAESSPLDSAPSLMPESGLNSQEHSPKMLPRRSFSVSEPSLDLQSVSGDLIKSHGDAQPMARRLHEQVEDVDYRQRRQSRRYSSFFNSVTEEGEDVESRIVPVHIVPGGAPPRISTTAPSASPSAAPSRGHSRVPSADINTPPNGIPSGLPSQSVSLSNSELVASRPEKDRKQDRKRFSFLSFYSSYNASRSSLVSEAPTHRRVGSQTSQRNSLSRPATRGSVRPSTQSSQSAQPAQQHQQQQQQQQQQQPQSLIAARAGRSKKNRQSAVPSIEGTQSPPLRPQGEQSTARKVMDFFKRRSMRV
ncbi:ZYBA0S09-03224g1_1 [Zygosaccharomyces bailii CLIB 213]|uniref:non-specific serine/threonine protein kinase n=1 Tax=Zygosaccharomyces bailii (strain CLIB 213 / ATCC 58445 / CBS 680 / BCRC 21525 / NBRC 1098 / NCYC 1416 / NRRL Y-2227) TaxID=1333698 RepID=A0A8J2T8Y7_ZYGB2|nr:ZYBA0S09-03224g1_1 [Zygosaccharomyces bailii CLIB 213]